MKRKSRERFQEIIGVFISYGFGYIFDSKVTKSQKSPENLRKAFEKLGPTFIKIGQILSTRSDILPDAYINELIKLQDSVAEEEFNVIKDVFEKSLNKSLRETFLFFEEKPMASASIAQVHYGILKDGSGVIVKIQRPDIYEKMKMDIAILRKILAFTKAGNNIELVNPIDILNELEATTEQELNFTMEKENILTFKKNNEKVKSVYAPYVLEELCSRKVLTMEYIDGFKINNLSEIDENGYDRKDIAKKLALSYCKQIFKDGFFHGDPHPGNLLIYKDKICFIDFGIMGQLDEAMQEWLNKVIIAVGTGDKRKITDFIVAIGIKHGKIDTATLYEDVSYMFETYMTTSLKNIRISILLNEVFNIAKKNKIQLPKELLILLRGLLILEGVITELDSTINIASVVTSFIKSKGKGEILKQLESEELYLTFYSVIRDLIRLPNKTVETLDTIASGRGQLNLNIRKLEEVIIHLSNMVNRIVAAVLISALVLGSSFIVSSNSGPIYKGISMIAIVGYVMAALFSIVLLYNIAKEKREENNKKS